MTEVKEEIGAGMVARYAALSADYLERYLIANKSAIETRSEAALALREMHVIAKRAYSISQENLSPAEEHKRLGALCIEEGVSQVHNTLALVAGAIDTIAKFDSDLQRPGAQQEAATKERGLVDGGELTKANFAALAKGLYAVSQHLGECAGAAMSSTARFPSPKAPMKLSGTFKFSVSPGAPRDLANSMGNRIASILYRHGNKDFATGHNSDEGGSGILKVRGEIVHWAKAIESAMDRGKKQGWEK